MGCSVAKEALSNRPRVKPVQFPGALGLDIHFSPPHATQIREHAYCGSQGALYLFDPCWLRLFLAYCAKGSNRSNFPWILLPMAEVRNCIISLWSVLNFSSFPPDSVPRPRFWNIFFGFILWHQKEFQFFRCPQPSRILGKVKRRCHEVIGGMRCGAARRSVQAQLEVRKAGAKRWLQFFNGKRALRDVHSEEFLHWEVEHFADALALRSLRAVPGVWRLSVWEQADNINMECFSLLWVVVISNEFHKELTRNFMGPCAENWSLFTKLGPRQRSGQSWRCRKAAVRGGAVILADDREANKAWCVDRQELFLYLTSQLLQDKHTWTHPPGLQERDVCTLLLTKSILGLPDWIRAGHRG